ncbi:MAG: LytTR family DNA-binding domain-containing protein [Bacteroidota bacterium]
MAYKCIIVDDEELARRLLTNHLSQLHNYELVASCASAIEANQVLKEYQVDLMFLDIEMPVLKGMDFFKNLANKPKVIFTTAYRDYAVEGFELDAVDYLLKPISFARFLKSLEKFEGQQTKTVPTETPKETRDEFIFVRIDRKQVKIHLNDIIYVESLKDYVKIHTTDTRHVAKYGISAFQDLLDARFLRTHRSYLVNRDKITAYTALDIEIGDIEIPIGELYKKNVNDILGG